MARRQSKNAKKILDLLKGNISHLESKWEVYQKQGYLFDTSSFRLTEEYLNELIENFLVFEKHYLY